MNKKEFEILKSMLDNIDSADDKIDPIERLYFEVKKMVNDYIKHQTKTIKE